jgi:hypothetical protein
VVVVTGRVVVGTGNRVVVVGRGSVIVGTGRVVGSGNEVVVVGSGPVVVVPGREVVAGRGNVVVVVGAVVVVADKDVVVPRGNVVVVGTVVVARGGAVVVGRSDVVVANEVLVVVWTGAIRGYNSRSGSCSGAAAGGRSRKCAAAVPNPTRVRMIDAASRNGQSPLTLPFQSVCLAATADHLPKPTAALVAPPPLPHKTSRTNRPTDGTPALVSTNSR